MSKNKNPESDAFGVNIDMSEVEAELALDADAWMKSILG